MAYSSKKIVFLFSLFLLQLAPHANAQDSNMESPSAGSSTPYLKDRLSAQFVAGALFGPVSWVKEHPTFNYAQTSLRFGWMASDPANKKYFGTGNFEILFELTNSYIFEGFGSYVRGFTLLGRYNLLLADPRWALYFQIGAGAVVNDAYKDVSQSSIGQAIEFTLQGSLGLHYFISRKWTVDVEAMFHHISNANLSERNQGTNAVGGLLGVTYFFGKRQQ
jgi:lipid A 3-O-deacylase